MLIKRLIGADGADEKAMIKQLTGTDEAVGRSRDILLKLQIALES